MLDPLPKSLLYILAIPGAGKTTLMAAVTKGLASEQRPFPVPHLRYAGGAELGGWVDGRRGADNLTRTDQTRVGAWFRHGSPGVMLGEGMRLSNDTFFQSVIDNGYLLTVVFLDTPTSVAVARRGSPILATDADRVGRLARKWAHPDWCLDGRLGVDVLASILAVHPVFDALRGAEVSSG